MKAIFKIQPDRQKNKAKSNKKDSYSYRRIGSQGRSVNTKLSEKKKTGKRMGREAESVREIQADRS